MVQTRTYQSNFTGGELAPEMQSRSDVAKYQSGVRLARNFIVRPQGGLYYRNGFEFVAEVADSTVPAWLIPMEIALGEGYVLEFGDLTLRFFRDGARVLKLARQAAVTSVDGDSASPGPEVHAAAHGFSNGEIVFMSGFADAPDINDRYFIVVDATAGTFRLQDRFGGNTLRIGMPVSGPGLATPVYEIATPYSAAEAVALHYAQDQNELYLFSDAHPPHRLIRVDVDDWTLAAETFGPSIGAPVAPAISLPLAGSFSCSVAANAGATTTTIGSHGYSNGDFVVYWSVAGPGSDLLGKVFEVQNATATTFTLADVPGGGQVNRTGLDAVPTGRVGKVPTSAVVYSYRVSAVDGETGEESLPSPARAFYNDLDIAGQRNIVAWNAVAGAVRYEVYKEDNGIYGFIGGTEGLTFTDENITPDLSDTPQAARNPFAAAGDYPATGTFFEQRLWFARTANNPSGVWASQTARPRNMNVSSPVKADDAISFRIRAKRVSAVQSLVAADSLLAFGSGGEWVVRGTRNDEGLSPTNVQPRQKTTRGSTAVAPVQVANLSLHVQRGGNVIRDFDPERAEPGTDLSVLSRHLFDDRQVVSWAFAQTPDSVLWVVLDDGSLVSLTYMLEHEIWGWTSHSSAAAAFFECVVVVAEGAEDAVYALVRRTVNGVTLRYVERLATGHVSAAADAFHLDAALRFGAVLSGQELHGLDQVEGEALTGVFDGEVVTGLVVTDGRVVAPFDANGGVIGLPYTGRVETLDLDLGAVNQVGSMLGRSKSIIDIILRVACTRGLFAGPLSTNELAEQKQTPGVGALPLVTGDVTLTPNADWGPTGAIAIEQRAPMPCYIAGLLVDWEFGE